MHVSNKPSRTWTEGVQRVSNEAAGVIQLDIIKHADLAELLAHAILGDPEAVRLANMASDTLRRIAAAPRRKPMLCASCPTPLRLKGHRFSVVVAIPGRDQPANALALAICHGCATGRDAVQDKAVEALKRLWPDLRPITVTHPAGGRA